MRQDAKICFGGLKIISALIFCAAGMVLQVLICMRDFNKRAAPGLLFPIPVGAFPMDFIRQTGYPLRSMRQYKKEQ